MLSDTVFRPSFGNRPSTLVGRGDFLADFDAALETSPGSRERALVILGQRGSGKTVMLWEMAERARKAGFVVATPAPASDGLLDKVIERIQDDGERYIHNQKHSLSGANLGALGFSVGLQFSAHVQEHRSFSSKIMRLAQALSGMGHGVLILVDELRADSSELRELLLTYQELVGAGLDVAIVLAGLPGAVSSVLNDKVLTFLNRAQKMHLPPLPINDIDAFYEQGFSSIGVEIDPDLRKRASLDAQGSPYLMQLLGHSVALNATEGSPVSEEAYARSLESALTDFENDVCETTLAALSDRDRDFLVAMSADDGATKVADIAARMGVTSDYAQQYRRRLIDGGIISQARYGYVEFAVPYMGQYLRRTSSDRIGTSIYI